MSKLGKKLVAYVSVALMIVSLMPMTTFATEGGTGTVMSAEFKAILNEDGKFEMKSVVPEDEWDAISYFCENYDMWEKYEGFAFSNFNEDFSACDISYGYNIDTGEYEETHRVEIVYSYDESVKAVMDKLIAKLPEWEEDEETGESNPYYFSIKDLELINYWSNCDPEVFNEVTMIDYSGEFKELMGYKNFKIGTFDPRAGFDGDFVTSAMGFAMFTYNDVLYGSKDIAFSAQHILYIPDDTADTREAIMAAAQARIDEYLGEGQAEIIGWEEDILDFLTAYDKREIARLEEQLDEYESALKNSIEQLQNCENEITRLNTLCNECTDKLNMELYPALEVLNTNLLTYQSALEIIDMNISESEHWITEYTNQKTSAEECIKTEQTNKAKYEKLLENATEQSDIDTYTQFIADCDSAIATAQSTISECEKQLASYEQTKADSEAARPKAVSDLEQCQADIAECEAQIETCNNNMMEYNQQIAQRENDKMDYTNVKSSAEYNVMNCESQIEWVQGSLEYMENAYNEEDGEMYFLQQAEGGYAFCVEIAGIQRWFVTIKDSDSMMTPEYKSSDASTDVSVESTDSSVPLDTLISVDKLTEGDEYDEIMNVLKVGSHETFDIKLFSGTLNNYVTKLSNGKFQVKIPIGATLKDKNLIVYYVDEKLEVHEYQVKIADGYAAFETDHFSVYTLADKDGVAIEVEDGKAEITEDIVNDAIINAGTSDVVTLPMEDVAEDVTSVEIPVTSLDAVASAEKALTIETTNAVVTLDKKALEKVVTEAGTQTTIVFAIDSVKEEALNTKQKDAIKNKDVQKVISAEILCNNKVISNFDGGKVTVQIPFTLAEGTKGSDYKVIYVADDGKTEDIATTYKDGCLVVQLEHFSEYAIIKSGVTGSEITGDVTNIWIWFAVLSLSTVAFGRVAIAKKKAYTNK